MGRKALIIATFHYEDADLRQLVAPAQDAEALQRVLGDPQIGGFEVSTLLNRPAGEVSAAVEDFFLDRARDDLLFLYFSGHGLRDENGRLYFATVDTKLLDRARPKKATAVSASFVKDVLQSSNSRRQVLVLDCCYSGAFASGLLARGAPEAGVRDEFEAGRGLVVLTASNSIQQSFEKADGEPSVFTRHLVRGVETGDADLDRDGHISLDELYEYIHDQVKIETPQQRPMKWAFDVEGEIVIAQVSDEALKPAELPPELQQAVASTFPSLRVDAVHDLELLLRGKHKGLARAASEALQKLKDNDDSRRVATAAADSLAKYAAEERLRKDAERAARERGEVERQAAEQAEAERKARERDAEEQAALEKVEAERQAREAEETRQKAEAERQAAEQAEAERKAREKAEQGRVARQKAEAERLSRVAEEGRRKAEAERQAAEQAEAERKAREKAEQDRVARQKAEAERLSRVAEEGRRKAEAERQAAEQAEAERKAREKAQQERAAREKAEVERKAQEAEAARRRAEAERRAAEEAAEARRQWLRIEAAEREKQLKEKADLEALLGQPGLPTPPGPDQHEQRPLTAGEIVEQELKRLDAGQILFNPSEEMQVGVRQIVEARVAKSAMEGLTAGLKDAGLARTEDRNFGMFMRVRLTCPNFDINPLTQEEQPAAHDEVRAWTWDVMPRKAGSQTLSMLVSARINLPIIGEGTKDYLVFHRSIRVRANPFYTARNFVEGHWRWLASGLLILAIAGGLVHFWSSFGSHGPVTSRAALTPLPPDRARMNALAALSKQLGELMSQGDSYYEGGDYQHAIEQYQDALGLDPYSLVLSQKVAGAHAAFRDQVETLTGQGDSAQASGDNQHAIEQYQSALALEPDNLDVREKIDKARAALKKQIGALIGQGDAYYASHQYAQALAQYQAARNLDSNSSGLGQKVKLARGALKQQIDTAISDGDGSYRTGDYDSAISQYQNAQALGATNQDLGPKIGKAQHAKSTELTEGTLPGSASVDLSLERMVRLLQGEVPDERMRLLVRRNHVSFERTEGAQDKLRAAGATDKLLAMIPAPPAHLPNTSTSSQAQKQSDGNNESANSTVIPLRKFQVTHQHTMGTCDGVLIIGNGRLEYQTDHHVDAFKSPLSQIVYGQTMVGGFYLQTADGKKRYFFSKSLVEIIQLLQQLGGQH
jgi:tetratricopeptide (TPR) repeat protein